MSYAVIQKNKYLLFKQGMKRSLRQFRDGLDSDYGNLITLKVE